MAATGDEVKSREMICSSVRKTNDNNTGKEYYGYS